MLAQPLHALKVGLILGLARKHQRNQRVEAPRFGRNRYIIPKLATAHRIDRSRPFQPHPANVFQHWAPVDRLPAFDPFLLDGSALPGRLVDDHIHLRVITLSSIRTRLDLDWFAPWSARFLLRRIVQRFDFDLGDRWNRCLFIDGRAGHRFRSDLSGLDRFLQQSRLQTGLLDEVPRFLGRKVWRFGFLRLEKDQFDDFLLRL